MDPETPSRKKKSVKFKVLAGKSETFDTSVTRDIASVSKQDEGPIDLTGSHPSTVGGAYSAKQSSRAHGKRARESLDPDPFSSDDEGCGNPMLQQILKGAKLLDPITKKEYVLNGKPLSHKNNLDFLRYDGYFIIKMSKKHHFKNQVRRILLHLKMNLRHLQQKPLAGDHLFFILEDLSKKKPSPDKSSGDDTSGQQTPRARPQPSETAQKITISKKVMKSDPVIIDEMKAWLKFTKSWSVSRKPRKMGDPQHLFVPIRSRLSPASGAGDIYELGGQEVCRRLGPPEYLKDGTLARYFHRDQTKLAFWVKELLTYYVKDTPEKTEEYDVQSSASGRHSYFTNICEGEAMQLARDFGTILDTCARPSRKPDSSGASIDKLTTDFIRHYTSPDYDEFSMRTHCFGPLAVGYVMECFRDYVKSVDPDYVPSYMITRRGRKRKADSTEQKEVTKKVKKTKKKKTEAEKVLVFTDSDTDTDVMTVDETVVQVTDIAEPPPVSLVVSMESMSDDSVMMTSTQKAADSLGKLGVSPSQVERLVSLQRRMEGKLTEWTATDVGSPTLGNIPLSVHKSKPFKPPRLSTTPVRISQGQPATKKLDTTLMKIPAEGQLSAEQKEYLADSPKLQVSVDIPLETSHTDIGATTSTSFSGHIEASQIGVFPDEPPDVITLDKLQNMAQSGNVCVTEKHTVFDAEADVPESEKIPIPVVIKQEHVEVSEDVSDDDFLAVTFQSGPNHYRGDRMLVAAVKREMLSDQDRIAFNEKCNDPSEMLSATLPSLADQMHFDMRTIYSAEQIEKRLRGPGGRHFRRNLEYSDRLRMLRESGDMEAVELFVKEQDKLLLGSEEQQKLDKERETKWTLMQKSKREKEKAQGLSHKTVMVITPVGHRMEEVAYVPARLSSPLPSACADVVPSVRETGSPSSPLPPAPAVEKNLVPEEVPDSMTRHSEPSPRVTRSRTIKKP